MVSWIDQSGFPSFCHVLNQGDGARQAALHGHADSADVERIHGQEGSGKVSFLYPYTVTLCILLISRALSGL